MKALFLSDIHGITDNLHKIEEVIAKLVPDYVVVLGDLYDTNISNNELVYNFLMKYRNKLILIAGNCDTYNELQVNNMILNLDGNNVFISHGHEYNYANSSKIDNSKILIYGHYHIPYIRKKDNITYICVGSISLPRNELGATYMVYDKKFIIYDIEDNVICESSIL